MRGGKREGAGRPAKNQPLTKVTVTFATRDKLNEFAKEINLPVVELVCRVINHELFENIISDIKNKN